MSTSITAARRSTIDIAKPSASRPAAMREARQRDMQTDPLRRVFFCRLDAYPSMIGNRLGPPFSCEAAKARTGA